MTGTQLTNFLEIKSVFSFRSLCSFAAIHFFSYCLDTTDSCFGCAGSDTNFIQRNTLLLAITTAMMELLFY